MKKAPVAPPATFVIFGGMGDLTRRLLMPALVNLEGAKLLDPKTRFIGVSRGAGDDAQLRTQVSAFVEDGRDWQRLAKRLSYIQGDFGEGLSLEMAVKQPGPLVETVPASLHFAYADQFKLGRRTGYETLLYDVLMGDQTLFQRADQIEGGWRAVQPLIDAWKKGQPEDYAAGSTGPRAADALIARDGRNWHPIG